MSDHSDKETVVVSNSSNPLGWVFAIILAAALFFVGYLVYTGYFSNDDSVSIELNVPEQLTPSE